MNVNYKILVIAVAILISSAAAGCQSSKENAEITSDVFDNQEISVIFDEAAEEFIAEKENDLKNEGSERRREVNVEYLEAVRELISVLSDVDKIAGGDVMYDESIKYTAENGIVYAQTIDFTFATTGELRSYMRNNMTDEFIKDRYSLVFDNVSPKYTDYNNMVYIKPGPKGGGFDWTNTPVKINHLSDNSFHASAEYYNYGAVQKIDIEITLEHNKWKISDLTVLY